MRSTATIVLTLIGAACTASTGIYTENEEKQQQQHQQQIDSNSPRIINGPIYSQNNRRSLPRYYYPTYPEYSNAGYGANGYAAQSGYNGYPMQQTGAMSNVHKEQSLFGSITYNLLSLSSKLILYVCHTGTFLLQCLLLMFFGGAFTTTICAYTSFCDGILYKNQVSESRVERSPISRLPSSPSEV